MDMYNSKFLRSIRSSERGADTYVCGRVCAEMWKSTVYRVDVLVDSCGIVQESQCECAAGMGPEAHCKHVCVVLLALTILSQRRNSVFGNLHPEIANIPPCFQTH